MFSGCQFPHLQRRLVKDTTGSVRSLPNLSWGTITSSYFPFAITSLGLLSIGESLSHRSTTRHLDMPSRDTTPLLKRKNAPFLGLTTKHTVGVSVHTVGQTASGSLPLRSALHIPLRAKQVRQLPRKGRGSQWLCAQKPGP